MPLDPSQNEVWMLDTLGNVHSLVNACSRLGFKVNRITTPADLASAKALPPPNTPPPMLIAHV